jgi:hypothetical protein
MAESLNMNGLNLGDSKHAPAPNMPGGRAYIPPHLRGQSRGPPVMNMDGAGPMPPAAAQSVNGGAWANNT